MCVSLVGRTRFSDRSAAFWIAQAAAKEMVHWGNGGAIMFYASVAGDSVQKSSVNEFHRWSAYATSKGAVHQMTRSMAVELAKHGIKVNSISPGQIYTA
jgi:NAD(P)-dependent dehydrogenase (short-subunit alcohol dehydrogenase family)